MFVGPLVAWAIARQGVTIAARETWIRELRENIAAFLSGYVAFRIHIRTHTTGDPDKEKRLAEINDSMNPPYHALCLLIAERGTEYEAFGQAIENLVNAPANTVADRRREFMQEAERILRAERAACAADPGVWSALWSGIRGRR